MSSDKSIKFITVYASVFQTKNINMTEALLISWFFSLNKEGLQIHATNDYLAKSLNIGIRNIQMALNKLEKKGWITKYFDNGKRIICVNYDFENCE